MFIIFEQCLHCYRARRFLEVPRLVGDSVLHSVRSLLRSLSVRSLLVRSLLVRFPIRLPVARLERQSYFPCLDVLVVVFVDAELRHLATQDDVAVWQCIWETRFRMDEGRPRASA